MAVVIGRLAWSAKLIVGRDGGIMRFARTGEHFEEACGARRRIGGRLICGATAFIMLLGVAGCGKDSSTESSTSTQVAATSGPSSTVRSTSTTATSGSSLAPTALPAGLLAWSVRPSDLGVEVGRRYAFVCPADGDATSTIWGTGPYTDDSAICVAAVHAGLITAATGGTVSFEVQEGADSYRGSSANGVVSLEYGAWPTQFTFIR